MNTYTVFAYHVPAGGYVVEIVQAADATKAVLTLRGKVGAQKAELEMIAVVQGAVNFASVDVTRVALAPYAASHTGD